MATRYLVECFLNAQDTIFLKNKGPEKCGFLVLQHVRTFSIEFPIANFRFWAKGQILLKKMKARKI